MTNVLVVGGAGYIGSHTCLDLAGKGSMPVAFDDLQAARTDCDTPDGARIRDLETVIDTARRRHAASSSLAARRVAG